MSELKSYVVYTPMGEVAEGVAEGMLESPSIQIEGETVYLKSEADKVIAEKNTKIIQLEAFIENHNRISSEIIDNANHQKYKRCLAIAKWCENAILGWMGV